ncbi:MAG: GNAT family N-acetyltransferase [Ktedonobacteraceae bacterium]|nr:GNAT family N-acetyltransferase [Ktedonobacteraceae bacterium]
MSRMPYTVVTLAQRPELEAEMPRLHSESWPEFVLNDPIALRYWGSLFSTFAEFQYVLCDEDDTALAAGHAIPLAWNRTQEGLPAGWDAALEQGFHDYEQGRRPDALCGLSIVIAPGVQGQGLSALMASAMKDLAIQRGLRDLIIPLRPSLKSQYPEVPMEEYAQWQREDGTPFDPWLRIHCRLGASIIAMAPLSMVITESVTRWEEWTGMSFPESGTYIVPGALTPILIDRAQNMGRYEEPNIWIQYANVSGA